MKKNISLLVIAVFSLFVGVMVSRAANLAYALDLQCDPLQNISDLKKAQDCKLVIKANSSTSIPAQDKTVTLTYKNMTELSNIKFSDNIGDLGLADSITKKDDKVTFVYHFDAKSLEKGKTYVLAVLTYEESVSADPCGFDYSMEKLTAKGGGSGGGGTDDGGDDPDTGVSIPVAVIGIGTVTGLTVYSISSRKTKFRRI